MSAVAYSDYRKRPSFYMDRVIDDSNPLIITLKSGRSVVLISNDEYENWQRQFVCVKKDQSLIRNFRGKLQWSGNLDEMRTDK